METHKKINVAIAVLFGLGLLCGAFSIGMTVGFHKARFSYDWGEQYDMNFGGPHHGIFGFREGPQFMDAHGTFGQIIKIDSTDIVVRGRDNIEKVILVDDDTLIQRMRETIQLSDLHTNDIVTIIGEPNEQGQISAKFIRLMP